MPRSLACLFVVLASPSFLLGQVNSSGTCELSVYVRTNGERGVQTQVQVQLLSTTQSVIATIHVSGGEPARFRVAGGATYRLSVSGTGIQPVTGPEFGVNVLEREHIETLHVKPEKQKGSEDSVLTSPTISITEMNVPKKASAEMNKGLDAYSKGNLEDAADHFEKAIAEYPRYARAYDMLGVMAVKRSDATKAREFFSKAIQVDETFFPACLDLARLDLQDHNYAESESLLAKVIAVNPFMPEPMALLASTEFANKEYDKALADVQRTQDLPDHEQFAELHIMAGKVLRMQNRRDAAIAQFQLFLKEKPDSPLGESVRADLASLQAERD